MAESDRPRAIDVGIRLGQPGRFDDATVAEVQLIRCRFGEAAALYCAAVEDDPEAKGNHESTRAQARRLMDKLAPSEAERVAIEAAFE